MSRQNLSPNYCSCTVNRARNLPDKGKTGGIDAFCTISLGKEKFVTAVREKTTAPDWHEQCDMPIIDGDTPVKLTVYNNNKNSLSKGDFIGRAVVSLRDLPDYDRVHTNWYRLTNKDGKADKDRGEIEVSLQFYSKNNTTGSVLDLATKKKHLSLKDIKHSLSDKLKSAAKHRKHGGDNQLADQRRHLGGDGGSSYLGRDFIEESPSESTSFTGSHMSLNSMSYNNNVDQQKKKSRAPNTGTPRLSQRSITSDYETSSILDSASMYGGDEPSVSSLPTRTQIPQSREVNVDEPITSKTKKKAKDPPPIIITTKPTDLNSSSKEFEGTSKADSLFGLKSIKENHDQTNEDIDFERKKTKKLAPILPQSKSPRRSTLSQSEDIKTPSTSLSIQTNPIVKSSTITKSSENTHDSTDDDVDELLGNLERMSSMRSSVKRKIQPRGDIMQPSFSETENKVSGGTNRDRLPDVVDGQRAATSTQRPAKPPGKSLTVLGYDNVKNAVVNPTVRQELEYIDREDLLHIIAHQSDIIKKRDTRLKDLEQYTDSLLVKIVEQCPAILQVGSSSRR